MEDLKLLQYIERYAKAPMVGVDGPRKELIKEDLERIGFRYEEDDIGNVYVFNTKEPKPVIVDAHMDALPFGECKKGFMGKPKLKVFSEIRNLESVDDIGSEAYLYSRDGAEKVSMDNVDKEGYLSPLEHPFENDGEQVKGLLDNAIGCAMLTSLLEEGAPIVAVYSVIEEPIDGRMVGVSDRHWAAGARRAVKRLSKLSPKVSIAIDVVGHPMEREGTMIRETVDEDCETRSHVYDDILEEVAKEEGAKVEREEDIARSLWLGDEDSVVTQNLIEYDHGNIYCDLGPSLSVMVALKGHEHCIDSKAKIKDIEKTYAIVKGLIRKISV